MYRREHKVDHSVLFLEMKRRGSPSSLSSAPFAVSRLRSEERFVSRTIGDTFVGFVSKTAMEATSSGRMRMLRLLLLLLSSRRCVGRIPVEIGSAVASGIAAAAALLLIASASIPSHKIDVSVVVVAVGGCE